MENMTTREPAETTLSLGDKAALLAKKLDEHGYRLDSAVSGGVYRYSVYAPQGWASLRSYQEYMEGGTNTLDRNDGFLGEVVVCDDYLDWILEEPVEDGSPLPITLPHPAHFEALVKLSEILGLDFRGMLYCYEAMPFTFD